MRIGIDIDGVLTNIEQYVIWKHPQLIEDTITIQVTTKY